MRRQYSIYVNDSTLVKQLVIRLKGELELLSKGDVSPLVLQLDVTPALPRRWAGFEIPLEGHILSSKKLDEQKDRVWEVLKGGVVSDIASHLYVDADGRSLTRIGAALISKCKNLHGSCLLIYWGR